MSKPLIPPSRFAAYQLCGLSLLSLVFYQDRRLCERRNQALERLKTGKTEFMDMASLAPPIPASEFDDATAENGEDSAQRLLLIGEAQVQAEEIAEIRRNWWKLRY